MTVLGTKINSETDRVAVDGRAVAVPDRKVYIALNKPTGVLCTSHDTHGRKTVLDLLPAGGARLYTVGRLDQDTSGLLFLTNDGTFSLRLTHPRYKMPKSYLAEVEGLVEAEAVERLLQGVMSDGEMLRAEKVIDVQHRGATTELKLVLAEGKKRQIRRMMDEVGHPVRKLMRLSIGTITLGKLKQGQWRNLTNEEVHSLIG